jgi:D-sedoheptulose 7-phosphate isomerase
MQINTYNNFYNSYFTDGAFLKDFAKCLEMLNGVRNIFFVGNGGSNAVCCHMMEDFAKIGRFRTFGFSDPALITCFSNDYGYENAMAEWMKIYFEKGDLLVAISSSGNSPNIINATRCAQDLSGKIITLTGFKSGNKLSGLGHVNFHLPIENYGVVECFHQVILHALLDEYSAPKVSAK